MSNPVQWDEDFDDADNSIWVAPSPLHDDGVHFEWRLKQELENNRIQWYAAHDTELGGNCNGITWRSLEEAKAAVQDAHDNIIQHELESE